MASFLTHTLHVPKNHFQIYVDHVLKKIYGLTDHDLRIFENRELPDLNPDIEIISETDEEYIIEYRTWNHTTLINVLPIGKITEPNSADPDLYDEISYRITCMMSPKDRGCLFQKVECEAHKIAPIMQQLVNEHEIQKYIALDTEGCFLCICDNLSLYIGIKNDILTVKKNKKISFDIDDGFRPQEGLTYLNKQFDAWKQNGDLTAPIITNDFGKMTKSAKK